MKIPFVKIQILLRAKQRSFHEEMSTTKPDKTQSMKEVGMETNLGRNRGNFSGLVFIYDLMYIDI